MSILLLLLLTSTVQAATVAPVLPDTTGYDDLVKPHIVEAQVASGSPEVGATLPVASSSISGKVRHDPLVILSRVPVDRWELNDDALSFELGVALREPEILQELAPLREATLPQWQAWQNAQTRESRESARSALRSALTKQLGPLLKKHTVSSQKAPLIAEQIVQQTAFDSTFAQDMVARIHGRHKRPGVQDVAIAPIDSYKKLFLTILGYDFDAAEYHSKIEVHPGANGRLLTDHHCLRQSIALILIAYTTAYDASFSALQAGLELSFKNVQPDASAQRTTWLQHWKERWYLNPATAQPLKESSSEEQGALRQWMELMQEGRSKAHERARDIVAEGLSEVWDGVCSLNARLDVLRMSDAAFAFPGLGMAHDDALRIPHVYSLLIGMTRVCLRKVLIDDGVLDANGMQLIFSGEMVAQRKKGHIPADVPTGAVNESGKVSPLSFSKKQAQKNPQVVFDAMKRRSYEAKMYATNGLRMDVLRGEGEQEDLGRTADGQRYGRVPIARALEGLEVASGKALYAQIMELYGELNLLRWHLSGARSHAQVMKALSKKLEEVTAYLARMSVPVADTKAQASYRDVIKRAVPWNKISSITFAHPRSLRAQLASMKYNDSARKEETERQSYRAMYQLMWLCVWHRLNSVVALSGHEQSVGPIKKTEHRLFAEADTLAAPTQEELRDTKGKGGRIRDALSPIAKEFEGVQSRLGEMLKKMTRRGKKIKTEGLEKALKGGDASVLIGEVDGMLDEMNTFLSGFDEVLTGVYKQTQSTQKVLEKELSRGVAVSKATMVCGHWVGRYAKNKISALQTAFQQLLNSKLVRTALWAAPKIPGHKMFAEKILGMLRVVSEENVEIEHNMAISQDNLRKAMNGTLSADEIAMPDAASLSTVSRQTKGSSDVGDLYGLHTT